MEQDLSKLSDEELKELYNKYTTKANIFNVSQHVKKILLKY